MHLCILEENTLKWNKLLLQTCSLSIVFQFLMRDISIFFLTPPIFNPRCSKTRFDLILVAKRYFPHFNAKTFFKNELGGKEKLGFKSTFTILAVTPHSKYVRLI